MFDPKKFTVQKPKPLPVMLLLDVSGSMSGIKIKTLNDAIRVMLDTFADEAKMETEIQVSIITFGAELKRLFPFTPVSNIHFDDLEAYGGTPLGKCLEMAKAIIEDRDETPSRAYRPTVILVSDGRPGDNWQGPLQDFITEGRSQKCDRMAMAIGADADLDVLGKFVEGTSNPLFEAHRATEIHQFFQKVTMSVTMRTRSTNPNEIPKIDVPISQSENAVPTKPVSSQPTQTSEPPLDGKSVAPSQDVDEDDYF